jgi:cytochrome c oxidase subunit II
MPIAVEVVPEATFAAWVASKGGTMPGAEPAAVTDNGTPAAQTNNNQQAAGAQPVAQN